MPLNIWAIFTGSCLIASEIIARTRKTKVSPLQGTSTHGNKGKNMVISNFIPFTRLNRISAFSVVFVAIIKVVQSTQIGLPTISIYCTVQLLLFVLTNEEAKKHFRRKLAAWRGTDFVEDLELQEQPIEPRNVLNSLQMPTACLPNLIIHPDETLPV